MSSNDTAGSVAESLPVPETTETWSAEEALLWAWERFGGEIAIASSFGAEDVALIDLAYRLIRKPFPVFTLDTDFLFPETYQLIETIEQRYGLSVERLRPELTPEQQVERHGEALWTRTPDLCCQIRKIEPLTRKLGALRAWVTGIRREQSPTRANAPKIAWDEKFGLVKINPIADWGRAKLWNHIVKNDVPYNPLHDRNYPSIGCVHCTRPVAAGEDERAGRWSGFGKTECGLHLSAENSPGTKAPGTGNEPKR